MLPFITKTLYRCIVMKRFATLIIVALLSLVSLETTVNAMMAADLPPAYKSERELRNEAYKQRLRESRYTRLQNAHSASVAAARQRADLRQARLAARAVRPTGSSYAYTQPFDPGFNSLLNGQQIETLSASSQSSLYSGSNLYGTRRSPFFSSNVFPGVASQGSSSR